MNVRDGLIGRAFRVNGKVNYPVKLLVGPRIAEGLAPDERGAGFYLDFGYRHVYLA